ncbi:MAG TPA: hypothetical protein ENH62_08810 [Marinobacter sp.]|uniref:Uncharacterized protein n=1 Tax=marine sediment metagenome TaxID=412755 RepID=A0A0F9MCI5_9ZZZZ|nr:hypothetical protein [Marinobacter sp.]
MANEIQATFTTGSTLYGLAFNAAGEVVTDPAGAPSFTAYVAGDIDDYDIQLAEIATNSTEYRGAFPVIAAGVYSVVLFEQAGGAPVVATDTRLGTTAEMHWDGTAEIAVETMRGTDGVSLVIPDAAGVLAAYILSDVIGADSDTLETLSDQLDVIGVGSGAISETYTVTDSATGNPIDGVTIWVTTDVGGANTVRNGTSNAAGQFTFYHDYPSGTDLYVWRQKAGWNFDNPDLEPTT